MEQSYAVLSASAGVPAIPERCVRLGQNDQVGAHTHYGGREMFDERIKILVELPNGKARPLQVPPDATSEELLQALFEKGALGGHEPDEFEVYGTKKLTRDQRIFEATFAEGDLVEIRRKPSRTDRYQFLDETNPGD
jgi:hypothetical protein